MKRISQFITGEADPFAIDVNTLFMLLVLTNQHMSLSDKLERK